MLTIIVEAPDCTGKTTLLANLRDKLSAELSVLGNLNKFEDIHCTYPPKGLTQLEQIAHQRNEYDDYIDAINDQNAANKIWLFDRFMTGELIYGPKYRNYSPDYIHAFEQRLNIDQTYFITLVADPKVIESRFDGEFIKAEDIAWLVEEYKSQFEQCQIKRKLLLDVSQLNPQQVCNVVYKFIRRGFNRHRLDLIRSTLTLAADGLDDLHLMPYVDGIFKLKRQLHIAQCGNRIIEHFEQMPESMGIVSLVRPVNFVMRNGFYLEVKANTLTHTSEADNTVYKLVSHNEEHSIVFAEREDGTQISIHGSNVQHISFI
jgi:hypothetical protein